MLPRVTAWWHALECVAVPCAIGLVMYALFGVWSRQRQREHHDELPPIDYHI